VEQSSSIERIRTATFTLTRRGYDKREVERFLSQIADWLETGGGDEARTDVVKRELERVGQRTASILSSAEDSAEQIRTEAEEKAAQLTERVRAESARVRKGADEYSSKTRTGADEYAGKTRKAADEYSAKTRKAADAYADQTRQVADQDARKARAEAEQESRETIAAGQAKAQRIVDEGVSRRRDVEAVIADLVDRRDSVIKEANRLADELRAVSAGHTPGAGEDPFDEPRELDPAERVKA
jgi:DivIVA domain-containing protein